MAGIILPNDPKRRGGLTIFVPGQYAESAERVDEEGGHICRVLVNAETGEICGTVFRADQERKYLRHLRQCVSDHRNEIHAGSPRTRIPLLDPNAWDPEIDEHMRNVGRRMLAEGRMEVRKNERAGF